MNENLAKYASSLRIPMDRLTHAWHLNRMFTRVGYSIDGYANEKIHLPSMTADSQPYDDVLTVDIVSAVSGMLLSAMRVAGRGHSDIISGTGELYDSLVSIANPCGFIMATRSMLDYLMPAIVGPVADMECQLGTFAYVGVLGNGCPVYLDRVGDIESVALLAADRMPAGIYSIDSVQLEDDDITHETFMSMDVGVKVLCNVKHVIMMPLGK